MAGDHVPSAAREKLSRAGRTSTAAWFSDRDNPVGRRRTRHEDGGRAAGAAECSGMNSLFLGTHLGSIEWDRDLGVDTPRSAIVPDPVDRPSVVERGIDPVSGFYGCN
jgi:hypothetical protein